MQLLSTSAGAAFVNPVDPIEWCFYELRGPATAHAGRWSQLTVELWAHAQGDGIVTDGRMSYPHDPGTIEDRYYSTPVFLRDGVDPQQAAADARRGAELLFASLERGAQQSAAWQVPAGSRPDRNPEQLDVWIRRESGARERVIVPVAQLSEGMRAARSAAAAFATVVRRGYVPFNGA
jgi:hypothetical protein